MKDKPDDKFYNRRLLTYLGIIFSVVWSIAILLIDIWFRYNDGEGFPTAKIIAYLGVPSTLAGLQYWRYAKACEKDDQQK